MSLCASRGCNCSLHSNTLVIGRDDDALIVDLPLALADAHPIYTFSTQAARNAALPAPLEGMEAFITSEVSSYRYVNAAWRLVTRIITQYTPTLTNITLGTGGVVTAQYSVSGGLLSITFRIVFGTGGSPGTGGATGVSLPLTIAALPSGGRRNGRAALYDVSTGIIYDAGVDVQGGVMNLYRQDGGGGFTVGATNPFAWANGDEIWGTLQAPLF